MNTTAHSAPTRRLLGGAGLLSAAVALQTLLTLLPIELPLRLSDLPPALLAMLLGSGPAALIVLTTALLGAAGAIAAAATALPRSGLLAVAALQVLVLGIAMSSMSTLSVLGYLIALAMPVALLVVLTGIIRRYRVGRWLIGVPVLVAAIVGVIAGRDVLAELAGMLIPSVAGQSGRILAIAALLGAGVAWTAAAISALSGTAAARSATARVTRHRRLFTVIAACGPLPYLLARLSWLTPWPVFGAEPAADPAILVWGLALSSGCWLGIALTLTLISPWGERFPRWMPVVSGRPVPVAAAVVPGGTVAGLLCFVAVPMVHEASAQGTRILLETILAFPAWFWGPALALAVWGYAGHRRGDTAEGGAPHRRARGAAPASARMAG